MGVKKEYKDGRNSKRRREIIWKVQEERENSKITGNHNCSDKDDIVMR